MHVSQALLAATRAEIAERGFRRSSVTSIAARAGMGRATLYRQVSSFDELIRHCLTAEFRESMCELEKLRDVTSPTRGDIVRGTRYLLESLRSGVLLNAAIDRDPEIVMPYVLQRLGRSQETVIDTFAELIAPAQKNGTVRAGDPRILAAGGVTSLRPFIVGRRLLEPLAASSFWLEEACLLLDRYLAPKGSA